MPPPTVAEIWSQAWFDPVVRARIALEMWVSWPVPVLREDGLAYGFFYYAIHLRPPSRDIALWPPSWVGFIAADGTLTAPVRTPPQALGLDVSEGGPFATFAWPADWTQEDADRRRVLLFEAYGRVVPAFVAGRDPRLVAGDVERFRVLFLELTPPQQLPSYAALGRAFFAWAGVV